MRDSIVRAKPLCEVCDGEIILSEFDCVFGFEHLEDSIVILGECVVCGEEYLVFFAIQDFIDIERDFLIGYYSENPELLTAHKKEDKEKQEDTKPFWFKQYRDRVKPRLIKEEKKRMEWCKQQRILGHNTYFNE